MCIKYVKYHIKSVHILNFYPKKKPWFLTSLSSARVAMECLFGIGVQLGRRIEIKAMLPKRRCWTHRCDQRCCFFHNGSNLEAYPTKSPGNKSLNFSGFLKTSLPQGFPKSLKVGSWWGQEVFAWMSRGWHFSIDFGVSKVPFPYPILFLEPRSCTKNPFIDRSSHLGYVVNNHGDRKSPPGMYETLYIMG